jgi:hypothetical protein
MGHHSMTYGQFLAVIASFVIFGYIKCFQSSENAMKIFWLLMVAVALAIYALYPFK